VTLRFFSWRAVRHGVKGDEPVRDGTWTLSLGCGA